MAGTRGVLAGILMLTTLEVVTRSAGSAKRTGELVQLPASALERFLNPNTPLFGDTSPKVTAQAASSPHPLASQPAGGPYSTPTTKPAPTPTPTR